MILHFSTLHFILLKPGRYFETSSNAIPELKNCLLFFSDRSLRVRLSVTSYLLMSTKDTREIKCSHGFDSSNLCEAVELKPVIVIKLKVIMITLSDLE